MLSEILCRSVLIREKSSVWSHGLAVLESYLCQQFSHHAVPLSGLLIAFPVLLVVHPLERVVELWNER